MILSEVSAYEDPQGNRIIGEPTTQDKVRVLFKRKNCTLHIDEGVTLEKVVIHFDGEGGEIRIGRDSEYRGMLRVGHKSIIDLGSRLKVTGNCYISAFEGTSVVVGDDCMFAPQVEIRSDDAHPIFDIATGARVNRSRSVHIGDHVWLSGQVSVWKGANIGSGSVIGFRSFARGTIPPNCIAVGHPAQVVREGVVWDKKHIGAWGAGKLESVDDLGYSLWAACEDSSDEVF